VATSTYQEETAFLEQEEIASSPALRGALAMNTS
jgi:hypothetical protein